MAPVSGSVGSVVNAGNRSLRGCGATRPEAADFGYTLPVHAKGLAKIRGFGEVLDRQIVGASELPDYADPPFQAGFCVMGSGSRPRGNGVVRAADSARSVSVHQDC